MVAAGLIAEQLKEQPDSVAVFIVFTCMAIVGIIGTFNVKGLTDLAYLRLQQVVGLPRPSIFRLIFIGMSIGGTVAVILQLEQRVS